MLFPRHERFRRFSGNLIFRHEMNLISPNLLRTKRLIVKYDSEYPSAACTCTISSIFDRFRSLVSKKKKKKRLSR